MAVLACACFQVDQAIEKFTPILGEIAHSGRSDTVKSTRLLQLIGSNSLLYTCKQWA